MFVCVCLCVEIRAKQTVVTSWKCTVSFFEGIGSQLWLGIFFETTLASVGSGGWVCSTKSAWSPSYEKLMLEIANIWTTHVDIVDGV